ncbi:MAG: hypothetical protein Kow006_16130 [Gammaproteobacteria bacterium]
MSGEEIICCVQDVHCRELVDRIGWAVRVRWFFVALCFSVMLLALLPFAPEGLEAGYFALVGAALLIANAVYHVQARRAHVNCLSTRDLRRLCFVQVMGDYLALAVVVYALGTVETPVLFLVLPNIIVVALFFTRLQGFLVTLLALLIVTMPLMLELAGVLPVKVLFDASMKSALLNQPWVLAAFLGSLFLCVLLCWYLVSTITDRLIHNELELEQSYEQLVRLDEERTRAVLRGTHELKAPLAAIKSYVYTLRDGYAGPIPERAMEIIERIGRRCDRLLAKITDIMRLSNLRTYVYTGTQFENLDLLEALQQFVAEAADLGRSRGVSVRLRNRTDQPVTVRASREHLHTLFSNLLSNAVQYSFDQGEVVVTVWNEEGWVVVEVADQGIGIPEGKQSQIFDEFFRAANAAAHHEGGTGLGLPIVKATARLLGASVEVSANQPRGSRFRVRLPLSTAGEG